MPASHLPRRAHACVWAAVSLLGLGARATAAVPELTVAVSSSCEYVITWPVARWEFRGSVPACQLVLRRSGEDRLGSFEEVQLRDLSQPHTRRMIRSYARRSSVVFEISGQNVPANTYQFPRFHRYPGDTSRLSYGHEAFSPVRFDIKGDAPWVFFDASFHTFILSPLNHFMISNNMADAAALGVGIEPQVSEPSPEFRFQSVLTLGEGINATFRNWGQLLTDMAGKQRPANDADTVLSTLGYWTDNRSSYYYNFVKTRGYAGTLQEIIREFLDQGLKLGHLQLDSWWYLKASDHLGGEPSWMNATRGVFRLQAAPELFPEGLRKFQQSVDLPLVAHSRWIDPASPYLSEYKFSRHVSIDWNYWEKVMSYLAGSGVTVYEQDWLNERALPRLDRIADGELFLDLMAAAASSHHLGLQYCMPLPRHFLQGSRYSNLLTIRTSGDGLTADKWDQFLFGSTLASAVGIWPWTDVFFSGLWQNVLIATLSAGIVGIGDRLRQDVDKFEDFNPDWCGVNLDCSPPNPGNLHRAVRGDGLVIKPDTSLLPLDQSYLAQTAGAAKDQPMAAAAFTYQSTKVAAAYVFAYARTPAPTELEIDLRELGIPTGAVAYSYWDGTIQNLQPGDPFRLTAGASGTYWIVVPKRTSGIALLGDLNAYVSMGSKQLTVLEEDSRSVTLSVIFAAGKSSLRLSLLAPPGAVPKLLSASLQAPIAHHKANDTFWTFELRRQAVENSGDQQQVRIVLTPRSGAGDEP